LLKDLVVLGKAAAVIAPGGSSKSQWLLQLAVGVATGLPVADHWEVGETGSVIVFFAEDDEDEIHRRIKRIQEQLTIKGQRQKLSGLAERLYVFSTIGKTMLLTRSDAAGEVVTTHIVNSVVDLAKQLPDLRLIVIDPASRFRGGEENSNEDATRFVEALETLAKATGASVMLAHHTNKGSYGPDSEPGQGASRGASALTDGLRWQMNLNRLSDRQAKEIGIDKALLARYVAATVTKTNYSAIPEPVILERLPGGYLSVVSATQAKNRAENDAMARVLWVVERVGPLSARDLEDLYGGLKQSLKMAKQNVRAVVKLAVERGLLAGGDRQPITITTQGTEMLRYRLDMDLATCALRTPPRRKVV
jgi:RecA-family ATPase